MRRMWAGVLALTLAVPALGADDKKDESKSEKESYPALMKDFQKENQAVIKEVMAAPKDEQAKVFAEKRGQLMKDFLPRFQAVAQQGGDDGFKALTFLVGNSGNAKVANEALATLLKDHEERLTDNPALLERMPTGEKVLRGLRAKATDGPASVKVAYSLANVLKARTEHGETGAAVEKAGTEAEALYDEVVTKGKDDKGLAQQVEAAKGHLHELRHLAIGKAMPELESKGLDDKAVKLSDLRGKVVVLDVWATWCGPCKAMIPHERELVKKLEGKPFALISVSCDAKKETLTKFLEDEQMPWTHWWDGNHGPVSKALNLRFYPTIYVLDAKGVIRYKGVRGAKMDEAVEALLKEVEAKG